MIYALPFDIKNIALGTDLFDQVTVVDAHVRRGGPGLFRQEQAHRVVTPYMDTILPNMGRSALKRRGCGRPFLAINRSSLIATGMMHGVGEAASTPINPNFFAVSLFGGGAL